MCGYCMEIYVPQIYVYRSTDGLPRRSAAVGVQPRMCPVQVVSLLDTVVHILSRAVLVGVVRVDVCCS